MSEHAPGASRGDVLRLVALLAVFVAVALALQLSGWDGPQRLREAVDGTGAWGVVLFVLGYAALTLVPAPASVLTLSAGALFGLWWGALLAWVAAMLGALGGFALGRRLGRSAVDRLLSGRLAQADEVLRRHGLSAVLAVRLLPLFPFTPLNYACGLLGVRGRDYTLGTAAGIVPGALAYAAVGASGADPVGIVVGVAVLVLLTLGAGRVGLRLLGSSNGSEGDDEPQE
ncbi:TVP38/TMEM64 family protein [Nocardioides sp.]|uniref:TVP38/TMEM64 family protein n=1 Tax=Nocardioides sp. TaxID=35761 RepID=UPI003519CC8D